MNRKYLYLLSLTTTLVYKYKCDKRIYVRRCNQTGYRKLNYNSLSFANNNNNNRHSGKIDERLHKRQMTTNGSLNEKDQCVHLSTQPIYVLDTLHWAELPQPKITWNSVAILSQPWELVIQPIVERQL